MNGYRYLFFDLDNTLWDFDANAQYTLQVLFERYQLDKHYPDFLTYYRLYSENNANLWRLYGAGKITKEALNKERFAYPLRSYTSRSFIFLFIAIHFSKLIILRYSKIFHSRGFS
jgi:FMN phosphatase YigB (HAD superfamily)